MQYYSQLTSAPVSNDALRKKAHTMTEIARVIWFRSLLSVVSLNVIPVVADIAASKLMSSPCSAGTNKVRFGIEESTWQRVEQLLRENWSAEQVCLWLHEAGEQLVSHESIYQYIHWDKSCGRDLHTHMRCKK